MRFKHDCNKCISLGQYKEYDLYFCNKRVFKTVVARYSNDGPDYISGMYLTIPEIMEAKKRAIAAGFIK